MSNVKEKIWNIELVVKDIERFPQTYKTILKDMVKDGTCQIILRRKLSRLCKEGTIFKTSIPGTRFGASIFFVPKKKYNILVEAGRIGSNVYCFFHYEKLSKYYIKISPYWKLRKGVWVKDKERIVFEGNVLKWV